MRAGERSASGADRPRRPTDWATELILWDDIRDAINALSAALAKMGCGRMEGRQAVEIIATAELIYPMSKAASGPPFCLPGASLGRQSF
jgi:hypothetical protein